MQYRKILADRDAWLHDLTRALVVGFVKTCTSFSTKGKLLQQELHLFWFDYHCCAVGDSCCILLDTQGSVVYVLTVDHKLEDNVEESDMLLLVAVK